MFEYFCTKDWRVVDGDTVDLTIDLGFSVFHKARIRLAGIDAPECRSRDLDHKARGLISKHYVEDRLNSAKEIKVLTELEKGKFRRVLGTVWADEQCINALLVAHNYAVKYDGEHKDTVAKAHAYNREKLIERGEFDPDMV
tara:strand:+ start:311 stop:733 length:423 start_codon:yes stop_codon:yes gene_type:complete